MKPIIHSEHIVKSTRPDVRNVPDSDIYSFMFEREKTGNYPTEQDPKQIAFIDAPTGYELSFSELKEKVNYLARSLYHQIGIREHDVVCFFSKNHINYPTAIWGVLRLGAIPTTANPTYTERELAFQLSVSGAKYIIVQAASLAMALKAAKSVNIPRENVIVMDVANTNYRSIDELVVRGKSLPAVERIMFARGESRKRLAFLCFSSGTSGLPKGVMISHGNVIANICQTYEVDKDIINNGIKKVGCGCLPFYHIYGLHNLVHQTLVFGMTIVVMPSFEPKSFIDSIRRYGITHLYIVPPILLSLTLQPPELFNFQHKVLEIYSAAAPLSPSLLPRIPLILPHARLRQAWGMTESAVCLTNCPYTGPTLLHSAGVLLPSVQLVLVDPETLESVPPSETGEVWARSPSIVMGYHGNPEATRETFDVTRDGVGWMRTGDEATFEFSYGDHWIIIKDRLKEMIKVLGQQVAPAELESILLSHPRVSDVAVVGRPSDKLGEMPWGFVVARGSTDGLEKELLKWVEDKVVRYKRIGGITFVPQIERNPSGKILRRVYRDKYFKEAQIKANL